jgi:hypothetical protein
VTNYIEIDPSTGLPKLGPDLYWLINQEQINIMQTAKPGEWTEWEFTTLTLEEFKNKNYYRLAAYRPEYQVQDARQENKRWWGTKTIFGRDIRWRFTPYDEYVYIQRFVDSPVTPDNLLDRATDTYRKWREDEANKEIYGRYPPQKFEAVKDTHE